MDIKLNEMNEQENALFCFYNGHIPEANSSLNNLQREKIAALYELRGKAYLGKINQYGDERMALTADTVFMEYTGQMVHNFDADYAVPVADRELAEMIVQWNAGGISASSALISRIQNRINEIGGVNLMWS